MDTLLRKYKFQSIFFDVSIKIHTFALIPKGRTYILIWAFKDIILFENLDNSEMMDNKQERSRHGCIYPPSYIPHKAWAIVCYTIKAVQSLQTVTGNKLAPFICVVYETMGT